MRFYQNHQMMLSEDSTTEPKQIRFKQIDEFTELEILKDGQSFTKTFPTVGVFAIDLSQITEGRWLYLQPDKEIKISINGGSLITLIAGKPSVFWVKFTTLSITTTLTSTRITIGLAGE